MENIGENQGTSRKIKRFFSDVNVLPPPFDALKRLGETGGLGRLTRCGERDGSFGIIGKTGIDETRQIEKKGGIEKTARRNERS